MAAAIAQVRQVRGRQADAVLRARTKEELPYFGPLGNLPKDFIDINFAFSRTPGQPKRYVQDLMRERAADLAPLLADPDAYFYVCGLKAMEEGVVLALRDVAEKAGLDWRGGRRLAQTRRTAASGDLLSEGVRPGPVIACVSVADRSLSVCWAPFSATP